MTITAEFAEDSQRTQRGRQNVKGGFFSAFFVCKCRRHETIHNRRSAKRNLRYKANNTPIFPIVEKL